MHQRQDDGSAAQKKMQQGKPFLGKTLNGAAAQFSKMRRGKIFFEKTLTASAFPPHSQLVLPAQFVLQHGDKMHTRVTLKNVENFKKWTVGINILFPQKRAQALLYYDWRAFAAANGLAIGDRLTFVLVAQSLFDVYILRSGGNSSPSVEKPKKRSLPPRSVGRESKPETKLCPSGPELSCDTTPTNGCEGTEVLAKTGTLFTKEIAKETGVAAEVAAEAPASSRSPPGTNSHCFEPMIQPEEHECIVCQIAKLTKLGMLKIDFHTVFNE